MIENLFLLLRIYTPLADKGGMYANGDDNSRIIINGRFARRDIRCSSDVRCDHYASIRHLSSFQRFRLLE